MNGAGVLGHVICASAKRKDTETETTNIRRGKNAGQDLQDKESSYETPTLRRYHCQVDPSARDLKRL